MFRSAFDSFKNENLTKQMVVLKRTGQVAFLVMVIGIIIIRFNQGIIDGNQFLAVISLICGISFLIFMVCFSIIGLFLLSKTEQNSTAQAIAKSFLRVFLCIFLPAIVLTVVLISIFGLPDYS